MFRSPPPTRPIQGNRIGVNAAGTGALPNTGNGVVLNGTNTTIGGATDAAANVIANSGQAGVRVNGGTGHLILRNSIFGNTGLGIDIGGGGITGNDTGDADTGANNLQNFPVLTSTVGGVQSTLNSTANTTFTVQYFANAACDPSGNGEGQTFLSEVTVTTGSDGNVTLPLLAAPQGTLVTATATSPTNDTSEFSNCVVSAPAPANFAVVNTNDSGPGSLRQAIVSSNATLGVLDTISFNVTGAGPHRIALQSALPNVTIQSSSTASRSPGTPARR